MITPADDFPLHQTPMPIAHPATGDRNQYDRAFFNGYPADAGFFFGIALGLYPNREVIDAAFSIVRDGVQRSVFSSARAPKDRMRTEVGAIRLEVLEPLRTARVTVAAGDRGVRAELTWRARTVALEEPRQTMHAGPAVIMDATRLVQLGTWDGWIELDGERITLEGARGTKDRSWGIRPVGEPAGGAPPSEGPAGVFMVWAPVHFGERCTHAIVFERADGSRWYESAAALDVLGPDEQTWDAPERVAHARGIEIELAFRPGTRRPRAATLRSPDRTLVFEPLLDFPMKGLGYLHPRWGHGLWHGERAEGAEGWTVAELDPLALENLHVEQLCRVRDGAEEGLGVLETLIIGPHEPSGLTDLLDGAGTA